MGPDHRFFDVKVYLEVLYRGRYHNVGPRRCADIEMGATSWVLRQVRASADENDKLE